MSWNDRVEAERLLLKRCHEGDREACRRFETLSCLNAIREAVYAKLEAAYPEERIRRIVVVCVAQIYSQWRGIPSRFSSLHVRVAGAATTFAANYRRKDLETHSPGSDESG
jgi:hypothetical protein